MPDVRDSPINFSTTPVYVSQDEEDDALVNRCLGGDTAAFEAIVERYQRVLFTVALRTLEDYDEACDATQNAFVKAFQHLATFDRTRRFGFRGIGEAGCTSAPARSVIGFVM